MSVCGSESQPGESKAAARRQRIGRRRSAERGGEGLRGGASAQRRAGLTPQTFSFLRQTSFCCRQRHGELHGLRPAPPGGRARRQRWPAVAKETPALQAEAQRQQGPAGGGPSGPAASSRRRVTTSRRRPPWSRTGPPPLGAEPGGAQAAAAQPPDPGGSGPGGLLGSRGGRLEASPVPSPAWRGVFCLPGEEDAVSGVVDVASIPSQTPSRPPAPPPPGSTTPGGGRVCRVREKVQGVLEKPWILRARGGRRAPSQRERRDIVHIREVDGKLCVVRTVDPQDSPLWTGEGGVRIQLPEPTGAPPATRCPPSGPGRRDPGGVQTGPAGGLRPGEGVPVGVGLLQRPPHDLARDGRHHP
ncbi:uncharacterized protein ACNS7B_012939 [Menidia menidia]